MWFGMMFRSQVLGSGRRFRNRHQHLHFLMCFKCVFIMFMWLGVIFWGQVLGSGRISRNRHWAMCVCVCVFFLLLLLCFLEVRCLVLGAYFETVTETFTIWLMWVVLFVIKNTSVNQYAQVELRIFHTRNHTFLSSQLRFRSRMLCRAWWPTCLAQGESCLITCLRWPIMGAF